jgi:hypothetical protein
MGPSVSPLGSLGESFTRMMLAAFHIKQADRIQIRI